MPGGEGGEGGAADEAPLPRSQLSEEDSLCGDGDAIEKEVSFAVENDVAWPSRSSATSRSNPCVTRFHQLK